MKSTINIFLQRQSLRLSLCAMAFIVSSVAFAQEPFDEEETSTTFKAPKRTKVVDKNPTINVQGYRNAYSFGYHRPVSVSFPRR